MAFPSYSDPIDVEALRIAVKESADASAASAVGSRTSDAITPSAGWSIVGAGDGVAKTGQMASLEGTLQRTGSALSISGSWIKIAEIPAAYRPAFEQVRTTQTNSGLTLQFRIETNGNVSVISRSGSQSWTTSTTFFMSNLGTWAVAAS